MVDLSSRFYAHSTINRNKSDWHSLEAHLKGTAVLAERFGRRIGLGKAARLAALLHDLGKYTLTFQARLAGGQERVDHSTAGASVVGRLAKGDDRIVAELIAYAIAGHHAGLPDKTSASASCLSDRLKNFSEADLDPVWADEIAPDAASLLPGFQWERKDAAKAAFQFAFLGRMIFSCLVDADFKDTEAFYAEAEGRAVDREWPALEAILPDLLNAFDRHMAALRKADTPVNRLRAEILDHVRAQAARPPGLFTLTVPTGGGKTLASLGFALAHAKAHGLDRIIYVIPFTSVIDQTAATFRDVLGKETVLEHHSAIDREKFASGLGSAEGRDKLALAMEDWAAPVVATTSVQFFESLFAARPSRCRKLHNIAGSVVVLDEAQTLPRPLLAPAVRALAELALNHGCTIVLCTATQPAIDKRNFPGDHPAALPLEGRELAPDPDRLAQALKRVTIRHGGPMDDKALVAALAEESQGLVIVNSRRHATVLYEHAKAAGLDGLLHLTTRQYAVHRRDILKVVKNRLGKHLPCRLIATSLVEAGVDLDFPRVWRAEAGLDQIAQAAGRCNREGERPIEQSIVTVFTAPDNPPPHEIKGLSGDMARMAHKYEDDLLSPAAMADFFGEVYWRLGDRLDAKAILDDFRLSPRETDFAYREVAKKFQMIESGMLPVIVPRNEGEQEAAKIHLETLPAGALARALQSFIVQVPPKARDVLLANGHIHFEGVKTYGDQFAVLRTLSLYTEEKGLLWENADYIALENSII